MKSVSELNLNNKTVLIRVDFNVPIASSGFVEDTTRISAHKSTIRSVLNMGGKVVLITHLGRPDGVWLKRFSLSRIVSCVEEVLNLRVNFLTEKIGSKKLVTKIDAVAKNEIILLENIRFYKEEKSGKREFCKLLSNLGDVYINDAFATSHRKHCSTYGVSNFFKEKCLGNLFLDEIRQISKVLNNFRRPLTIIVGGSKIRSKIGFLSAFIELADNIIIGGAMMFAFIKSKGGDVGNSLYEKDDLKIAKKIILLSKQKGVNLVLPNDSLNAAEFKNTSKIIITECNKIPKKMMGLDIGPKTIKKYKTIISNSATIVWNGPMGAFEFSNFSEGTKEIAKAIVDQTKKDAFSLVGGGDSISALKRYKLAKSISHVSTGGGAMLEFFKNKTLPAIEVFSG